MTTSSAESLGKRQIGGIAVEMEYHVAGVIPYGGIRVRCAVVQELSYCIRGSVGAFALFGCDTVESDKHGAIDSSCII